MNEVIGFNLFILLLLIFIGFLAFVIFYLEFLVPFLKERKNIKLEIERSNGKELLYWRRCLKKLYVYSIPVIGCIIKKLDKK